MAECFVDDDHDWVRFSGDIAHIGVCDFKLSGLTAIQEIIFTDPAGFKKRGQVIANIISEDYSIPLRMPVDGIVTACNPSLLRSPDALLAGAHLTWMVKVQVTQGLDSASLTHWKDYRKNSLLKNGK